MKTIYIFSIILILATGLIVGFAVSKNNNEIQAGTINSQTKLSVSDIKNVSLKSNVSNTGITDIVAQLNNGDVQTIATYNDIYVDHYHPIEYLNGDVYVIRRIGDPEVDSGWTDQLWKIGLDGSEVMLYAEQGIDFRVSSDEQYIAIADSTAIGQVFFINKDGVKVKSFLLNQLAIDPDAKDSEMYSWSNDGKSFWGGVYFANQEDIFQISVDDWTVQKFAFDGNLHNHDWDLNPDINSIVYSDYPSFGDATDAEDFDNSTTVTHLYLANFITGEKRTIDTAVAKSYQPKWISSTEIQYSDPTMGELKSYFL